MRRLPLGLGYTSILRTDFVLRNLSPTKILAHVILAIPWPISCVPPVVFPAVDASSINAQGDAQTLGMPNGILPV